MSDYILYGLAGLIFYQAYVTVRLVQSKTFPPEKKARQALFIWMIPFIGAAATLAVLDAGAASPGRPDKKEK